MMWLRQRKETERPACRNEQNRKPEPMHNQQKERFLAGRNEQKKVVQTGLKYKMSPCPQFWKTFSITIFLPSYFYFSFIFYQNGDKREKNKGKPIIVRVSGVFTTGTLFVPDSEKQVIARVLDIPSICPRTGQNGENDCLGTNFQHSFCFVRMIHLSPGCRKGQFGDSDKRLSVRGWDKLGTANNRNLETVVNNRKNSS